MPSSPSPSGPPHESTAPWTDDDTVALTSSQPETTHTWAQPHDEAETTLPQHQYAETSVIAPVSAHSTATQSEHISATAAWDNMRPAVTQQGSDTAKFTTETMRSRQKKRFGGMQMIPGLFGWLSALSVSALLLIMTGALGSQWGVDTRGGIGSAVDSGLLNPQLPTSWVTLGVFGVIEVLAFLAGGYVAGRMARFSGVAQGVAVWLWSLLARALASVAVFFWADAVGLIPQNLTAQTVIGPDAGWGLIALLAVVLLDLLAAILGGVWGMRHHRKVDAWTVSNVINR